MSDQPLLPAAEVPALEKLLADPLKLRGCPVERQPEVPLGAVGGDVLPSLVGTAYRLLDVEQGLSSMRAARSRQNVMSCCSGTWGVAWWAIAVRSL